MSNFKLVIFDDKSYHEIHENLNPNKSNTYMVVSWLHKHSFCVWHIILQKQ